jgi:hypothetical protein
MLQRSRVSTDAPKDTSVNRCSKGHECQQMLQRTQVSIHAPKDTSVNRCSKGHKCQQMLQRTQVSTDAPQTYIILGWVHSFLVLLSSSQASLIVWDVTLIQQHKESAGRVLSSRKPSTHIFILLVLLNHIFPRHLQLPATFLRVYTFPSDACWQAAIFHFTCLLSARTLLLLQCSANTRLTEL